MRGPTHHRASAQFTQKTPPSHRAPPVLPPPAGCTAFEGELKLILKEIKVISGKVKDEVGEQGWAEKWTPGLMILFLLLLTTSAVSA